MNQKPQATERFSADYMGSLLSDLCHLVAERSPAEVELVSRHEDLNDAAQVKHAKAKKDVAGRYEKDKTATETEAADTRRRILARFDTEYHAVENEYQRLCAGSVGQFEEKKAAAQQARNEAQWEASAVLEAVKSGALAELKEAEKRIASRGTELSAIHREAVGLLRQRHQWRDYPDPEPPQNARESDPVGYLDQLAPRAKDQLGALHRQSIPRFFEGAQPLVYFVLLCLGLVFTTALSAGLAGWPWILPSGLSAVVAVALYAALAVWLYRVARRQSVEAYMALKRTLAEAAAVHPQAQEAVHLHYQRRVAEAAQRCNDQARQADRQFNAEMADLKTQKELALRQADAKYPALLTKLVARRDRDLEEAHTAYSQRLRQIDQRYRADTERLEQEYSQTVRENDQQFRRKWNELADRWQSGIERFQSGIEQTHRRCDHWFPNWSLLDCDRWVTSTEIPPVFRFGHYQISLRQIEGGIPNDQRLRPPQTEFQLPALLPFPEQSLLLLKSSGRGRDQAIRLIQGVMLRMLTAIPPGKVRFTIIDPVRLGENFSAFMHLADYLDQLVTSRIWTDPAHIEQRLADLTDHMENVLQVYLRNEFDTIQQYNDFAGEMAEAYRVLVVANFPVNFTEVAAQRLKSIVTSGARCGVFTLLALDTKLPMPRNFNLADVLPHALCLDWREGRFLGKHDDYGALPLVFDEPPETERFTRLVRAVGSRVQEADRVEVPFECVAPEPGRRWTADSRGGLDVPLGRAGAKKLQHLSLGKGTSHHVLVAGKTGSGKSNLMHALIVNLGLRYGPDEVDLYLVDFKKGVEFKPYGSGRLPHARVVAIESEREFGLSVLARLDEELKRRGDLFRQSRVQDIQGYRGLNPGAKLPRILLIVDEFQELFVEDDRLAQDAALYLDRLVRQGRAFGIHVLLGSQTLAGAYSLARSTIGQMAVRIALQCSETDAHLILSEENTAARLLTRPGEAIYNDANGLYEGNHPFQVVWLPDQKRDEHLRQIHQLAGKRRLESRPPIVFEGNAPANPGENPMLAELLSAPSWPDGLSAAQAWLGAPVAIKSPTAAQFVRQTGSNLLLVGHREEAALGVLATCLISLAAQHAPLGHDNGPPGARFYVFDGMRPNAPETGLWNRLAAALPHEVHVVPPRAAAKAISHIAEELARRREADEEHGPPLYLIVDHLSRFRDLRRADDDFGFSSFGEERTASPAEQFAGILREGPELGIHSLLWCDTYNSVMRSLDRHGLRDVEMRVLFQMNAADSSNLIDSPAASRLGVYRAVLYDEGQGHLEKFRPYGLPSDDWLAWVRQRLHARAPRSALTSPEQP